MAKLTKQQLTEIVERAVKEAYRPQYPWSGGRGRRSRRLNDTAVDIMTAIHNRIGFEYIHWGKWGNTFTLYISGDRLTGHEIFSKIKDLLSNKRKAGRKFVSKDEETGEKVFLDRYAYDVGPREANLAFAYYPKGTPSEYGYSFHVLKRKD